ncbi:CheR family methyltransferase [Owenweeksia hongkongensis]|uniref:CheR family methyltransferase n=1 Tax=Owenweeksia hongkongensis TaxID=253245 RepID=UPI003A925EC6
MTTPQQTLSTHNELFIAGIGASAGSLDFIKEFILSLPTKATNLAVVLAQHRSAEYTTHIHQIIKVHKPWTIEVIENKVKPQAGHIYINPSGEDLWLEDGILHLKTSSDATTATPSVDRLFESLAREIGSKCIGIILSGTGKDGTLGAEHIKNNNGHVIVQDPSEAPFKSMPQSVISKGYSDVILPTSLMVAEIESYIHNANTTTITSDEPNGFKDILKMLSLSFGTDFSSYKPSTIKRRLNKRINQLALQSIDDYYQFIQKHPGEIGVLFETMLIGVTEFFRNEKAFEILRKYLEKILAEKSVGDSIRVWSVGCSTGEEPFSIAILLHEILGDDVDKYSIQIFATDIDQRAIAIARKGIYTLEHIKNIPSNWLGKYFYKTSGKYELKKTLRQHVLFSKHDITTDPPFVKLDLLSCRNLLIYFDANLQREVIPVFHYAVNPKGYLFLGKSENISNMGDLFSSLESNSRIFQKNHNAEINTLQYSSFRRKSNKVKTVPVFPELSLDEIITETLAKTFEYPYVVLDEDMQTLLIKGSLQPYLELSEGSLNSNILKILNPAIHAELRTCFNKVKKEKEAIESHLITFEINSFHCSLTLLIKPLIYAHNGKQNYIVIFKKIEENERFSIPEDMLENGEASNIVRIMELEQELEATREHLKAFTEELEVGNEELQAVNEELQSANEELKSSNEELETSNEELQSANEELQSAISELDMSHQMMIAKESQLIKTQEELEITKDRFETALANSNVFIGYQDSNLRYYWLYNTSPGFESERVVGKNDMELLGEEGKELSDIKHRVLIHKEEIHTEIEMGGNYWEVSCKPIVKKGEVIGVKTVAFDITLRRNALREKHRSVNITGALLKDFDDMLLVVDNEWNIIAINRAQQLQFERRFNKTISEKDNFRRALKDQPEALERANKLLNPILSGKKINFNKVQVEESSLANTPFYYSVQGFPLTGQNGEIEGGIIISSDITSAVQVEERIEYILRHTTNLTNDDFFHSITDQLYNLFKAKHIYFAEIDQKNNSANVLSYRKEGQRTATFSFEINRTPLQLISQESELQILSNVNEKFPEDKILARWNAVSYIGVPVSSPTSGEFLGVFVMVNPEPIRQIPNSDYLFKIIAMRAGAEIETNKNIDALKNREKQLNDITSNLPEMIYEYVSTEFMESDHFTFVSTAASDIYEVEADELLDSSQLAWDAIYEEDLEDYVIKMEQASQNLTTLNWTGRIVGNKTYKLRWVKITAKPERIDSARVKWYGVVSDISKLKQMENELQYSKSQAEKLAAAKEDFLAIMSHEIRTPLNGIMGITELMMDEASEKEMEYLGVLKFSADNLMSLINNILDFSKINAGKVEVLESKISLPNLLKNVEHSHNFKARENNNELIFEVDENLPGIIYGDDMIIVQILNNLLSNANKFTKQGNVLLKATKVSESNKDVEIKFEITDTGVGIAEEDIDKIFEKFQQLGGQDQRSGGTGLGLGIVKKLIEVLGSNLHIQSELGEGSSFYFNLTLSKVPINTSNQKSRSISEGEIIKILIAEDMADNRDLISKYLSRYKNYSVSFAKDGVEVVNKVKQDDYDIILMDLRMPKMGGREAAAVIRSWEGKYKKIPIIALTADTIDISYEKNFNDLIPKPISSIDLHAKIEKYIQKRAGN